MPTTMAFSRDSQVLAAVYKYEIRLFEASSGELIRTLKGGHKKPIVSLAFSGDGKTLASGTYGLGPIVFWNYKQGKLLRKTKDKHRGMALDFSPDGKWLAISSEYASIKIWNVKKNSLYKTVQKRGGGYASMVRFSPDGKLLGAALANKNRGITLFSVKSGRVVKRFRSRIDAYCLNFSTNGKYLAAGASGETGPGKVYVYDLKRKRKIKTLKGHKSFMTDVHFLPDNKHIISSSREKFVRGRIWNIKRGRQVRKIGGNKILTVSSALSPDGKYYIVKLKTTGSLGNPVTVKAFGQ